MIWMYFVFFVNELCTIGHDRLGAARLDNSDELIFFLTSVFL